MPLHTFISLLTPTLELSHHSRYSLNIKNLPFKTKWVEYPDIESTIKSLGGRPTGKKPDGSDLYTLPVIYDPNTSTLTVDSFDIALYLDKAYPSVGPQLMSSGAAGAQPGDLAALNSAFTKAVQDATMAKFPLCIPLTGHKLNPPSNAYWWPTRQASFGMPMSDYYPKPEKLPGQWAELENGFSVVAKWYVGGGEQLFVMGGDTPSWGDVVIASWLYWIRWIYGPESAEWKGVEGWDNGRWKKLLDAMKKYNTIH